ncbi:hypothetical protein AMECASPLE_039635 [Ameca splendens]|uniref:Uncharacterized protein n=1 Tax=Ameca splendens TaxID=208324 RepID=A0ABV0YKB8_9TELE
MCRPRVCPNSGAGSFQVRTCGPITSQRSAEGTKEHTGHFIKLRSENDHLFTGAKNSAPVAWRTILEKMGQQVSSRS